jgi:hypothetical protein
MACLAAADLPGTSGVCLGVKYTSRIAHGIGKYDRRRFSNFRYLFQPPSATIIYFKENHLSTLILKFESSTEVDYIQKEVFLMVVFVPLPDNWKQVSVLSHFLPQLQAARDWRRGRPRPRGEDCVVAKEPQGDDATGSGHGRVAWRAVDSLA